MTASSGHLRACGFSDPGKVRDHNEDAIRVDAEYGLALLADGMGGHNAGEVASAIAVNRIAEQLLDEDLLETVAGGDVNDRGFSAQTAALKTAVSAANTAILRAAKDNPECRGMGTTLVGAWFHDGLVSIAHVGDSRLYRFRDGVLEQLTTDHTLVQELVSRGVYSEEEARQSLNKNVITRALGTDEAVKVDLQEELVCAGDIYLLCSDGLSGMVDDAAIGTVLQELGDDLEQAGARLIDLANDNGGHDNVSVVLVGVDELAVQEDEFSSEAMDWFD